METKISVKTIYLLLVISIGLVGLAVGSTFAVFTASAEIEDPISFSSNLTYTDNVFETLDVEVPGNSTKEVNFSVSNQNNLSGVNYAAWYVYDGSESDISVSTTGYPTGTLDYNSGSAIITINSIPISVTNNTSNAVSVTLGIMTSKDDIVLPSYMKIVTSSTVSQSYTVTIVRSANTTTTLKTSTVTANNSFTYDFSSSILNGTTYTYNRVSCTNSQVAVVSDYIESTLGSISTYDKTLTIASVTADTTCTLYYTSSSSGGDLTS